MIRGLMQADLPREGSKPAFALFLCGRGPKRKGFFGEEKERKNQKKKKIADMIKKPRKCVYYSRGGK